MNLAPEFISTSLFVLAIFVRMTVNVFVKTHEHFFHGGLTASVDVHAFNIGDGTIARRAVELPGFYGLAFDCCSFKVKFLLAFLVLALKLQWNA